MQSGPPKCQAKVGFVILHKCGELADAQCGTCGKQLCRKHAYIKAGAPVCESCLKKAAPEEYEKVVRSRPRYGYYYGYRPYYYGHYHSSHSHLFDRESSGGWHEDGGGS